MKQFLIRSILIVSICLNSYSHADDVIIVKTIFCPMSCNPKTDQLEGYLVEIAKAAFKGTKHNLIFKEVDTWSRALVMVQDARVDGMIPSLSTVAEAEGTILMPEEFISNTADICMIKKGNPWRFKNIKSLDSVGMLGVISGGDYGEEINLWMKNNPKKMTWLGSDHVYERALKMIKLGRIDVFPESKEVLYYTRHKLGFDTDLVEGGETFKYASFIGFGKQSKKAIEYNKIVTDYVRKIRHSGELDELFIKYGLPAVKKNKP